MKLTLTRAAPRKKQAGQAMVEYALILTVLAGVALLPLGPADFNGRPLSDTTTFYPANSFMGACILAYKDYYRSYYYVLNLPFP